MIKLESGFDRIDVDGSGAISAEEYAEEYEVFFGFMARQRKAAIATASTASGVGGRFYIFGFIFLPHTGAATGCLIVSMAVIPPKAAHALENMRFRV